MSTVEREGKRGFRVYPNWDIPQNSQAQKTQKWQLDHFFEIDDKVELENVLKLYGFNFYN